MPKWSIIVGAMDRIAMRAAQIFIEAFVQNNTSGELRRRPSLTPNARISKTPR